MRAHSRRAARNLAISSRKLLCALKKKDRRDGVREGEGHFLNGGRTGLADVIAADRDRVPVRELLLAVREDVGHDPERMPGREDVGASRHVFFQDVVLHGTRQFRKRDVLAACDRDVQREQDDGGRVDGHRRRDAIERDPVEQRRHVLDRIDRHPDPADFALRQNVIRVVPHLCGQVECDAQAADALRQQVAVARVRFRRRSEAGVLADRPQAASIHRGLHAARKGVLARETWVAHFGL
jgi:hypothetical protein